MSVTDDRVGQYRLKRQIHGRGAFGEVHVAVGPARADDESTVIWAVAVGERSIRPDTDPLEFSAALDGASRVGTGGVSRRTRNGPDCPCDACRDKCGRH
jgi:hypothetical protein